MGNVNITSSSFITWDPSTYVNHMTATFTEDIIIDSTNYPSGYTEKNLVNSSNGITIDGGGYTVYVTTGSVGHTSKFGGLFALTDVTSDFYVIIKNLNIVMSSVNLYDVSGAMFAGLVFADQSHLQCDITDCNVTFTTVVTNGGGMLGSSFGKNTTKNINIRNCNIQGTSMGSGCGGLAGINFCRNSSGNILIDNCKFLSTIDIPDGAGGLIGTLGLNSFTGSCIISNCLSNGTITGGYESGDTSFSGIVDTVNDTMNNDKGAGGIVGSYFGYEGTGDITIDSCTSTGEISGGYAGGIVGSIFGCDHKNTIKNCISTGDMTGDYAGGIVGRECVIGSDGTTILNCSSSGEISGFEAGGIIGGAFGLQSNNFGLIIKCRSSGKITGDFSGGIVGGICCPLSGGITRIENCSSSGEISVNGSGGIVGGMCGYQLNGEIIIINCHSSGDITGPYAGGIIGSAFNPNGLTTGISTIEYCHSTGTMIGTSSGGIVGSLFGYISDSKITLSDCYSSGDINGDESGGVTSHSCFYKMGLGTPTECVITKCYTIGNINGIGAGGITGSLFGSLSNPDSLIEIQYCYTSGDINGVNSGGITGMNADNVSTINTCYTTGMINGATAGGITGSDFHAKISYCYTLGNTIGTRSGSMMGATTSITMANMIYCYALYGPFYVEKISHDEISLITTNRIAGSNQWTDNDARILPLSDTIGYIQRTGLTNMPWLLWWQVAICFNGNVKVIMADRTEKLLQNIIAGDIVMCDNNKTMEVKRLIKYEMKGFAYYIMKNLIGNHDDIYCSEHPIWCNNGKNRILPKNIKGVKYVKYNDNLYNIQFETEGSFYVNNIKVDSLSPENVGYYLSYNLMPKLKIIRKPPMTKIYSSIDVFYQNNNKIKQ